ncbi:hypothetical protein [Methylogaea oryzae]|uniref:Uncharacterized protein n=2 Tax=Methylogaea oryzae TaxID=1295382 RepID=A0A8D5AJJ0_9GAMM|nr:hypothetical protein [Methylogaea oryzae]BBL70111.1 hypothetical protein MoryE10_07170 [Methylogaea oryzae]
MYVYRIMGALGAAAPERVVLYAEALALESNGRCAIVRDTQAKQTKYLFMGEESCTSCGRCAKPPLLVDIIRVPDRGTEVVIKSRRLSADSGAQAYCRSHGVTTSALITPRADFRDVAESARHAINGA